MSVKAGEKPPRPPPIDDDNIPNFMKPLKRNSRRKEPNPLEPNNQVAPQKTQQSNGHLLSPQNAAFHHFDKNQAKVEPFSLSSSNFLGAHETSINIDAIMEKAAQEVENETVNFQSPKIQISSPKDKKKSKKKSIWKKDMPKYQLKYLNLRAKAEPIRLLLNFVQEPFEDHRENYLEFAKYKDKFPLPRLPRLIVDGKLEISYVQVILSYLARKYGLEPESDEDKAICDTLGTHITTYMDQIKPFVYCLMGLSPVDMLDELTEKVFLPCVQQDYGPVFEAQLEKNNTGYLIGDKLTWLDFYAACFTDYCISYGPEDCMDKFKRLGYHRNAVFSLPQIQSYLQNRPATVY